MNINNVYLCDICVIIGKNDDGTYKTIVVDSRLVYRSEKFGHEWFDLETNEEYETILSSRLFINPRTMVPLSSIIETKRDNMTKRKILKMYKNTNGGKK